MASDDTQAAVPRPLLIAAAVSWRALVVAAAVFALVYAMVELRLVVLPVIVAVFAATLLVPPVRWLVRRGVPELGATFIVLLGSIAVVVALVALLAPTVVDEFEGLGDDLREGSTKPPTSSRPARSTSRPSRSTTRLAARRSSFAPTAEPSPEAP